jgi:hypothetical protein
LNLHLLGFNQALDRRAATTKKFSQRKKIGRRWTQMNADKTGNICVHLRLSAVDFSSRRGMAM